MSHKVRVGVVGTSDWSDSMYLPALQSHPQVELAAICGRNQGRADVMAAKCTKEYQWRFDQKRANGILGDLGVHMIDMARWLVGDITRVSAQLGVFVERIGANGLPIDSANDSSFLLVEFTSGTQGLIQASGVAHMADRGMQQEVQLYGEAGSLEIKIPYGGLRLKTGNS